MAAKFNIKETILENRLDFLYGLYLSEIPIGTERFQMLQARGYIAETDYIPLVIKDAKTRLTIFDIPIALSVRDRVEQMADSLYDIEKVTDIDALKEKVSLSLNGFKTILDNGAEMLEELETLEEVDGGYYSNPNEVYSGKLDITKDDWCFNIKEVGNYPKDFVDWIDSINIGYQYKKEYKRFNLYRQQAENWIAENEYFGDFDDIDELKNYIREEQKRIRQNTLYAVNKYGYAKEQGETGELKLKAWDAQAIVLFLIDLGLSLVIAKARQIGFTTILGIGELMKLIVSKSRFSKFITETSDKGVEIFDDKIKFGLSKIPYYLKPTVANDSENQIRFACKPAKGQKAGVESKMLVSPPYIYAINGGSPDAVYIDEIGMIQVLGEMINEARPTLYKFDPVLNKQMMLRQIVAWGTGGKMEKAGVAMEQFYSAALENWRIRNFKYGFVPLFLNAYARPGITDEWLEAEKEYYYSQDKPGENKYKIQFHQAYPITISDVFLTSLDTVIPIELIEAVIRRIDEDTAKRSIKRGYFVPVYDYSRPIPLADGADPSEQVFTHVIVGSDFIELANNDPNYVAEMYRDKMPTWINRDYQGTDPIITNSGHSRLASVIWDKQENDIVCMVNFKGDNFAYCWSQAFLMGIYYDKKIKHLVEQNVGEPFMNWVKDLGFGHTIVPSHKLPTHLRSGAIKKGISKRGGNGKFLIHETSKMVEVCRSKTKCKELFIQLKTFVRKVTNTGHEKFEPNNKKLYFDDVIDAATYGYICAESYIHLSPINTEQDGMPEKVTYKWKTVMGTDYRLKRVQIAVKDGKETVMKHSDMYEQTM